MQNLWGCAGKGQLANQRAVENSTEGVNVSATIDLGASGALLRRHERGGSHRVTDPCQLGRVECFGHTKICQHGDNGIINPSQAHRPRSSERDRLEQNIARLYVAMNNPSIMRKVQRHGNRLQQTCTLIDAQAPARRQQICEAGSFDQLHGDIGQVTLGRRADLKRAHDVWVT